MRIGGKLRVEGLGNRDLGFGICEKGKGATN